MVSMIDLLRCLIFIKLGHKRIFLFFLIAVNSLLLLNRLTDTMEDTQLANHVLFNIYIIGTQLFNNRTQVIR